MRRDGSRWQVRVAVHESHYQVGDGHEDHTIVGRPRKALRSWRMLACPSIRIVTCALKVPNGCVRLGLYDSPATSLELIGELRGRNATDQLLCRGSRLPPLRSSPLLCDRSPQRPGDGVGFSRGLCFLQLVDESSCFVPGELACGLTLCEPHWAAGVPKIDMACVHEQGQ